MILVNSTYLKLLLLLNFLFAVDSFGQTERTSFIKIGAFPYFLDSRFNGFSVHLEYERTFRKINFLTSGPRLDYVNPKTSHGSFLFGYEFKLYPFNKLAKKKYQGLFVGIDPLYVLENPDRNNSRYGPGLGLIFGYQRIVKNDILLSLELSIIYMQDINKNAAQYNPEHRYWYEFASLKIGRWLHSRTE